MGCFTAIPSYNRKKEEYPRFPERKKFAFVEDEKDNIEYCHIFDVMVENETEFTVTAENGDTFVLSAKIVYDKNAYRNFKIVTSIPLGYSIKRKSKRYPNGVRLTREMLNNSVEFQAFKEGFEEKHKAIQLFDIATFVVKARKTDLMDIEAYEAYKLEAIYDSLPDEDSKKAWLIENGFTGVEENFGVYTSRADGWGHTTGRATMINFRNKSVYVGGWSSDD